MSRRKGKGKRNKKVQQGAIVVPKPSKADVRKKEKGKGEVRSDR